MGDNLPKGGLESDSCQACRSPAGLRMLPWFLFGRERELAGLCWSGLAAGVEEVGPRWGYAVLMLVFPAECNEGV